MRNAARKDLQYDVRFFFIPLGSENSEGLQLIDPSMVFATADKLVDKSDVNLKKIARDAICKSQTWTTLAMTTHCVVADVGFSKESDGLGASHPIDTLILFRPN